MKGKGMRVPIWWREAFGEDSYIFLIYSGPYMGTWKVKKGRVSYKGIQELFTTISPELLRKKICKVSPERRQRFRDIFTYKLTLLKKHELMGKDCVFAYFIPDEEFAQFWKGLEDDAKWRFSSYIDNLTRYVPVERREKYWILSKEMKSPLRAFMHVMRCKKSLAEHLAKGDNLPIEVIRKAMRVPGLYLENLIHLGIEGTPYLDPRCCTIAPWLAMYLKDTWQKLQHESRFLIIEEALEASLQRKLLKAREEIPRAQEKLLALVQTLQTKFIVPKDKLDWLRAEHDREYFAREELWELERIRRKIGAKYFQGYCENIAKFSDTLNGKKGIKFLRTYDDFLLTGEEGKNCVGSQWNCYEMEELIFFNVHLNEEVITVGWNFRKHRLIGDLGRGNVRPSSAIKKYYQDFLKSQGL